MNEQNFKFQDLSFKKFLPLHRQIEEALRERILNGTLPAGLPLPPTNELAEQMGVHPLTLQKALRRLKVAGLLRRTPRVGSFVSKGVRTSNLAIVVGPDLKIQTANFHRALVSELQKLTKNKWLTRVYDGFTGGTARNGKTENPALQKLHEDNTHLDFKGIIAIGISYQPWTDVDALRKCPRAWLSVASTESELAFDFGHFVKTAVDHLEARGCRKIAYIRTFTPGAWARSDRRAFTAAIAQHGITDSYIHDFDTLGTRSFLNEYDAYQRISAAMDEWRNNAWPDAIIVSDDVLTRAVAMALLHITNGAIPRPTVLTWANENIGIHYGLPVIRYEIPVTQCATMLYEILMNRLDGKKPSDTQILIQGKLCEEMP